MVGDEGRGEGRGSAGCENGDAGTGGPEHETGQPLLKPEADCGGDRAVDDGDPARCAAEQDRRPEAPVAGSLEAFEMLSGAERDRSHALSAPPPTLKKLGKKLDAANDIDRHTTTTITRPTPPLPTPNTTM